MKKLVLFAVALVAISFASCKKTAPEAAPAADTTAVADSAAPAAADTAAVDTAAVDTAKAK